MLVNRVKKIVAAMKRSYSGIGGFAYPRVDNNYNKNKGYSLYPHPVLDGSVPLRKQEYFFTKNTALLELSNQGLLSPSAVFKSKGMVLDIDTYFNEKMDIKVKKNEELVRLINNFDVFLKNLEINENYLKKIIEIEKAPVRCAKSIEDTLEQVIEKSISLRRQRGAATIEQEKTLKVDEALTTVKTVKNLNIN